VGESTRTEFIRDGFNVISIRSNPDFTNIPETIAHTVLMNTNDTNISSTHITCSFPITGAEPGLWNVTVTNYDGQTGSLPNGFTVFPPQLSVTSISPSTGVNTGSVTITNLSGTLFQSGATVNLTRTGQLNITATNVQVVSSSQITCTLPLTGKAAGQGNIIVTNPDGQSGILANGFTVTAANPGNTPFVIDPSAMNTFDGQYLKSRGYGWCDFGGVNNSYYKITLTGTSQYPTEFHHEKFHHQSPVRDPGAGIKCQGQRSGSLHNTQR